MMEGKMPGKRTVTFNNQSQSNNNRTKRRGRSGHGGKSGRHGGSVIREVEMPRYTLPDYLSNRLSDIANSAPGHRFLIYFQGTSYTATVQGHDGRSANKAREALEDERDAGKWQKIYSKHRPSTWEPIRASKRAALNSVVQFAPDTTKMLNALIERQKGMLDSISNSILRFHAKITAPIAIGLGNPHPVENGFSFLCPYGLPYIPGSGIKGPIRRSAEELALFNSDSGWTIPLVWILFGFEANSGYITPPSHDIAKEIRERHDSMREAFVNWIESDADSDESLKWWLKQVAGFFPEKERRLATKPAEFCKRIIKSTQEAGKLRQSIHWKGLLRFWDAFPLINSMAVDILNPHHKGYYDGNHGPIETEVPKPVFFLTIPPDAHIALTIELDRRLTEFSNKDNIETLIKSAVTNCVEWIGFGGKTSVGYGLGEIDEHAHRKEAEEREKRIAERDKQLKQQKAAEEKAKKEAEKKARLEAELASLPEDLAWLKKKEKERNWEEDNSAFLSDAELFFQEFSTPGEDALRQLAERLEKKWKGIMANPDATKGKKKKPKYKPRPRELAKKLISLLKAI